MRYIPVVVILLGTILILVVEGVQTGQVVNVANGTGLTNGTMNTTLDVTSNTPSAQADLPPQAEEHQGKSEDLVDCLKTCDDRNPCNIGSCASGRCIQENIKCSPSKAMCADGFVAACENSCVSGACTECAPSCEGHDVQATLPTATAAPTATPIIPIRCTPNWQCVAWSDCVNDQQNRSCSDANACAPATTETRSCIFLDHVIFSEVFYDTPGSESNEEWLKLYNPTNGNIDMSNWSITDNSGSWKFAGIINSKSSVTIARNAEGFKNLTGCDADIVGFTRGLNNDGDQLTLKNSNNDEIDFVAWEKGANSVYPSWNVTAKEGKSIRRITLAADTDSISDWFSDNPKPC